MYTVTVMRDFVAQHFLIGGDWGAENLWHSHHYKVEVRLEGATLDQHGYLVDIVDIETNLEALVSHTATGKGMAPRWVLGTRGWAREDWDAAVDRLRGRGLLNAEGELTEAGVALRKEIESRTDRLDAAPYEHLGAPGVERLTELATGLLMAAMAAGAFPEGMIGKN